MEVRRKKSRVGGKACAAYGCTNTAYSVPKVSLHVFPHPENDKHRHETWVSSVKQTRAHWKGPPLKKSAAYENCVLCSDHFEESCFEKVSDIRKQSGYKCRSTTLKADAIPTKFAKDERILLVGDQHANIDFFDQDETEESNGTIIPVDEIPASAVPVTELCDVDLLACVQKKKAEKQTKRAVQPSNPAKISRARKKPVIPETVRNVHSNHTLHTAALLHHDYVKTMTKSIKDYILRTEAVEALRLVKKDESNWECKTTTSEGNQPDDTNEVTSVERRVKFRKRKSESMSREKRKFHTNYTERVEKEDKVIEILSDDAQTPIAVPVGKINKVAQKKKYKKSRSLLMYGGKSKLQRNSHKKYAERVQNEKRLTETVPEHVHISHEAQPTQPQLDVGNHHEVEPVVTKRKSVSPRTNDKMKKQKRKRCLSMYRGRTKLERNPHRKYRQRIKWVTKSNDSVAVKEEPSWNGGTTTVNGIGDQESKSLGGDSQQDHQMQLVQSMYAMQKSGTLCDFTIIVGSPRTQRQFPILVHRLVLAAVSNKIKVHEGNVLKAFDHVNILDAPRIIEFAYTGKIEKIETLPSNDIGRLHDAAVFLDVPKCVAYLKMFEKMHLLCKEVLEMDERDSESFAQSGVASFIPPPLGNLLDSSCPEDFEVAENIRIESIVSRASDTTDTSDDDDPCDKKSVVSINTDLPRRKILTRRRRPSNFYC